MRISTLDAQIRIHRPNFINANAYTHRLMHIKTNSHACTHVLFIRMHTRTHIVTFIHA